MKVFHAFIPGKFIDAFAYRGRLLAIAEDTSIHVLSLDKIAAQAEFQVPSSVPLPDLLFARNNWMSDPKYRLFVRNPNIAGVLLNACESLAQHSIECSTNAVELSRLSLSSHDFHYPLDVNIYNGRLFVATEEGFYHQDFVDWDVPALQTHGALERRHDGHTMHTSSKYGTVNISCGSDGLLYSLDEFQLRTAVLDRQEEDDDVDLIPSSTEGDNRKFKRFKIQEQAGMSFKSDWCSFDIVNYIDSTTLKLLATEHESKPEYRLEGQSALLQGFTQSTSLWELPRSTQNPRTDVNLKLVDHIFNADQTFYIHTVDGDFYSARVRYSEETSAPTLLSMVRVPGIKATGVCKTASIQYGLDVRKKRKKRMAAVVECFDEVFVVNDVGETIQLSDRAARTVRTFPNSKQYQNLVVVARDDGLWLHTIFDDTVLVVSNLLGEINEVLSRDGVITDLQLERLRATGEHTQDHIESSDYSGEDEEEDDGEEGEEENYDNDEYESEFD